MACCKRVEDSELHINLRVVGRPTYVVKTCESEKRRERTCHILIV